MKLLMTADAVGGVWTYATELAAALADAGAEVVIAVMGPDPIACSDEHRGYAVIRTGLPLDWLADGPEPVRIAAEAIRSLAHEVYADVVQLNSPALAGAVHFDLPVVAVAHGCVATWWEAAHTTPLPARFAWHAELMRRGLEAADVVVAPSASYAAIVQRRYGLARPPSVIHNGRAQLATAVHESAANHAFTAGRLWDAVKRTPLLDAVAARLAVPLRAAGPTMAPQGEQVEAEHLHLLGTLSTASLGAEYATRPVFVSAASFEPFGLAVLEAAQAGCALVLSDIATFRELWEGAASFVAGDDPGSWAEAIEALIADPARREALGKAALDRASRYTPAKTAEAMLAIYRRLAPGLQRAAA